MVKYCANCGAELSDGALFCDKCGKSTSSSSNESTSTLKNNVKTAEQNKPNNDSFISKIFYKRDNLGNKKLNKRNIGIIAVVIIIIAVLIVASGILVPKTTYEFNDFSLTLPSDYQATQEKPLMDYWTGEKIPSHTVKVVDKDGMLVGTVSLNDGFEGILDRTTFEDSCNFEGSIRGVDIGGHKGFINEKKFNGQYMGLFMFEDKGNVYSIAASNITILGIPEGAGTYEDIEMIAEGFEAKAVSHSQSSNTASNNAVSTNSNSANVEDTYSVSIGGESFTLPSDFNQKDTNFYEFTFNGQECEIGLTELNEANTATKTFSSTTLSQDYQGAVGYVLDNNGDVWTGIKIGRGNKCFCIAMNTDNLADAEELFAWMSNHNTWSSP